MIDFALSMPLPGGVAEMDFAPGSGLLNNIYLSLAIKKGRWWHDPQFGMLDRPRMKNTDNTARLVRQDAEQALQWIVDAGRAKSIQVDTWRDPADRHRLNIRVVAIQSDGQAVTYTTFKEVV